MLVYLKEPMASTEIDGKRIYGKSYSFGTFGPTELSVEQYKKYRDILIDAEYSSKWIKNKFGTDSKAFKFSDLKEMPLEELTKFARKSLGLRYHETRTASNIVEKNALLRYIMHALSE